MAKETAPKKPAAGAAGGKKKKAPLPGSSIKFPARPRSQLLGGNVLPKTNLGRFVKWPKYVRLQRQKKVIQERLKVPPALNLFKQPASKNQAHEVFALLNKYRPETKKAKAERLKKAAAELVATGKKDDSAPPAVVKFGLKHVTALVETKKAKLVLVACDVDPIELVVWLPALCRKFEVPFMVVQSKSRLGEVVGQKTATCVALTRVNKEDEAKLKTLQDSAKALFNDNKELLRKWGGGKVGERTRLRVEAHRAALEAERAKKAKMLG